MDNSTVNNTSASESAPKKEPWTTPVLLYLSRGDDEVNKNGSPTETSGDSGPGAS